MIFITAKFRVLPEHADRWTEIVDEFTRATRSEPGRLCPVRALQEGARNAATAPCRDAPDRQHDGSARRLVSTRRVGCARAELSPQREISTRVCHEDCALWHGQCSSSSANGLPPLSSTTLSST